ncbi:hypothetical protein LY76DRAFT_640649 [Colletotrichum caudatum]|nr:hypothetical protein LY76DRAFT_640649 [Colletotrichum caudatum]
MRSTQKTLENYQEPRIHGAPAENNSNVVTGGRKDRRDEEVACDRRLCIAESRASVDLAGREHEVLRPARYSSSGGGGSGGGGSSSSSCCGSSGGS